jgi:WD40 repeat protein
VTVSVPDELVKRNRLVGVSTAGTTKVAPYFASEMDVTLTENYGQLRVFDVFSGDEKAVLDGHRGLTAVVAFGRDGKGLATGGSNGTAVVWDVSGK